nr:hypothetical protein [Microbacterium sp. NIBRBAC000506063]
MEHLGAPATDGEPASADERLRGGNRDAGGDGSGIRRLMDPGQRGLLQP